MKAGLFDRAEDAYKALAGSAVRHRVAARPARPARARARVARRRSRSADSSRSSGTGSFASRIAHYRCELALEADAAHQTEAADAAVAAARDVAPRDARPLVLAGERAAARGDHAEALRLWNTLMSVQPASFNLVARRYAASARAAGKIGSALERLRSLYEKAPTIDLLETIAAARVRRRGPPGAAAVAPARASDAWPRRRPCSPRAPAPPRPGADGSPPATAALPAEDATALRQAVRRAAKAAASLSLRRLRLRGRALFLAMSGLPRLGHVSPATTGGPVKHCRTHARTPGRGPRARRRRRDARSLLVRRGRADLARSAGAGRARQPREGAGAPGRRGQRRLATSRRSACRRASSPPSATTSTGIVSRSLLGKSGIESLFKRDPGLTTIVKLRVIGRSQQLLRVDFEEEPDHEVLEDMRPFYEKALAHLERRCSFSDYGKGGLTHIPSDDRAGARRRPAGARRPEGRATTRATGRHRDHAEPRRAGRR